MGTNAAESTTNKWKIFLQLDRDFYKIKIVEITVHNEQVQDISTARGVYTEEIFYTEYIIRWG